MAEKASAERVAADMQPPNFRGAVLKIQTSIYKKKDKLASINGEIADDFAKIEGMKVNKKAARIFMMLDKLEAAERHDIFQSLNGLAAAAGWDQDEADLVDKAEGNVVPIRFGMPGGDAPTGDDDGDAEMDEVEKAIEEPAASKRRGARKAAPEEAAAASSVAKRAETARNAAREHLGGDGPPFTGDNSDLKPE